ncbi:mechanosensitive ion channel family protein [Chitinophaga horti]|uniref:Mechanosensitive ion channel family protein n=1 Tax=Chitinophaga horti TaxID=2920382 RepID=A0ABY6J433_9BACT|nr:mechanosensitive ion channel family protein [Chitinophaga horti]UYQ93086.1 mechanosensitive ion channel family protein [Chitinophaga horti]
MNDFLNSQFLGNPILDYLIVIGVVLLVLIIRRILSTWVASISFSFIKGWTPSLQRSDFVNLLVRPLEYLLVFVAFMLTINRLHFPPQLNFPIYRKLSTITVDGKVVEHMTTLTIHNVLTTLLELTVSLCFIWIFLRLIDFVALVLQAKADLTEDKTDNQFVSFFKDFFKAIVVIIGALIVIRVLFGQTVVEKLIAGLGIGAAALALAAKESIENLIGSFIIFSDRPFRVGDFVKVDSYQGTVEKIGLRSTRLRTLEKTYVTVPNKKMVDSVLDNLSLRTQQRAVLRIEAAADTPADKLEKVIRNIQQYLEQHKNVEPDYVVNLNDFTKDSYVIQVIYLTYILDGARYNTLREDINLAIMRFMEEQDVKIAAKVEAPTDRQ